MTTTPSFRPFYALAHGVGFTTTLLVFITAFVGAGAMSLSSPESALVILGMGGAMSFQALKLVDGALLKLTRSENHFASVLAMLSACLAGRALWQWHQKAMSQMSQEQLLVWKAKFSSPFELQILAGTVGVMVLSVILAMVALAVARKTKEKNFLPVACMGVACASVLFALGRMYGGLTGAGL